MGGWVSPSGKPRPHRDAIPESYPRPGKSQNGNGSKRKKKRGLKKGSKKTG